MNKDLRLFAEAARDVQLIQRTCPPVQGAQIVRGLIQVDGRRAYRAALLTSFS